VPKASTSGPAGFDSRDACRQYWGEGRQKTVRGEPVASHVLLIEDEPNIAEAIRFLLTRDGLRVSHAAEGRAALALLRQDPPDMVILDHMLPGLSGLEILSAIRAAPESRDLPVMMLTARGRDREMAERAGADRFMTKPFSNAEIIAEVRAMLSRGPGRG
jgi:DNA-binding response OmpR family regulator